MDINDLSYSNIVSQLQGEEKAASEMLVCIATEKEKVEKELEEAEHTVNKLKSRQASLRGGAYLVAKHLGKHIPLAVQGDGFIVVLSGSDLSIERNVI